MVICLDDCTRLPVSRIFSDNFSSTQFQNLQIYHCQNRLILKFLPSYEFSVLNFLFSILYLPFFRYDGFLNGKHHNGTKSGRYKDRIEYYSDQHLHNQQIHHSMENRWGELEVESLFQNINVFQSKI